MSFRELLTDFYQVHAEEKIIVAERNGFMSDGLFYFTIDSANYEIIFMEQAVLAYYLFENGYRHVALPIRNREEEWFSDFYGSNYLLYQLSERNLEKESPGKSLAVFHQIGSNYQFEPQTISSYGQWKKLWIDKLTVFEERIVQFTLENETQDNSLLLDALPYIIGVSENAIQYLRETEEEEYRYAEFDQGTIAFLRYSYELQREAIWPDQFVYDHPARDLAEHIRLLFLTNQSDRAITEFLQDYQSTRPLSFFSWRLIYARLLFPLHLFDAIEQCLMQENHREGYQTFKKLLQQQGTYEKRLQNFFEKAGINKEESGLVEVDWL